MKFLIVALAIISVCAAQSDADWEQYQIKYGKAYRSADEAVNRRAVWENNWKKIKQHNEKYAKGETTYTLGENQFADMTYEEFSKNYLGLSEQTLNQKYDEVHQISGRAIDAHHDLRHHRGLVSPVRDQGKCGGCWAFSATASVEVLYQRLKGLSTDVHFSPQYLIDCSKGLLLGIIRRNNGCSGGQIVATYDDMKTIGNRLESAYPYKAADGTCPGNLKQYLIGGSVQTSSEAAIMDAVFQGNAVNVGIYASDTFQLYKSGIYTPTAEENAATPNHAVLVIGYNNSLKGGEHYVIKNSWHEKWGEDGYIRLSSGKNPLKITGMAAYPKF